MKIEEILTSLSIVIVAVLSIPGGLGREICEEGEGEGGGGEGEGDCGEGEGDSR